MPAIVLSVGAVALLAFVTRAGLALRNDSVAYLGGAHSIANGHGYTIVTANGVRRPVLNWPPLYPLALAGLELIGLKLLDAARAFNLAVFAAASLVLYRLLLRASSGSRATAMLGTTAFIVAPTLMPRFGFALSDPLFLFLLLATIAFLDEYLRHCSRVAFFGAAVTSALACATREAGIALVLTGLIVVLLHRNDRWARWTRGVVFGAVAIAPFVLWNAWTVTQPDFYARSATVHFELQRLQNAYGVVSRWLFPEPIPSVVRIPLFAIVICFGLALAIRMLHRQGFAEVTGSVRALQPCARVALCFAIVYTVTLCFTMWFLGTTAATRADDRQLSPVFVACLIIAASVLSQTTRGRVRVAAVCLTSTIIVLYAITTLSDAASEPIRHLSPSVLTRQGL